MFQVILQRVLVAKCVVDYDVGGGTLSDILRSETFIARFHLTLRDSQSLALSFDT